MLLGVAVALRGARIDPAVHPARSAGSVPWRPANRFPSEGLAGTSRATSIGKSKGTGKLNREDDPNLATLTLAASVPSHFFTTGGGL